MKELIDVLDSEGNKLGFTKLKDLIKQDGDFHRAIKVCIINNDNEVLFSKRSREKVMFPLLWSMFITGHVREGEASIEAAVREIKEELGIDIYQDELEYLYTSKEEQGNNNYIENIFFDTYMLRKDIPLYEIKLNEENEQVQFISLEDAKHLINSNSPMIIPNDYKRILEILNTNEKIKKKIQYENVDI